MECDEGKRTFLSSSGCPFMSQDKSWSRGPERKNYRKLDFYVKNYEITTSVGRLENDVKANVKFFRGKAISTLEPDRYFTEDMNNKESERIPLTLSDNHSGTYESFVSRDNSIIYCCHGNAADECCNNVNGKLPDMSPNSRRESILTDSHCHDENEVGVDKVARRRLVLASVLCLLFMVGEAVGGILANSLAIATDAAHLLTDFASFMISLMAIWVASRPATKRMSFGWYRAEVIGALTSVLLIWVVTGVLVYMAAQRIINEEYEIDAEIMLITAAVGVGVNVIMGVALQAGGVSHGHSHGGSETKKHGHQHEASGKDNINVRAAFIHVIGDFIQSLGVLIAALVIYYKKEYAIVDPICTFFFSILVLITTFAILRETLNVLMEGMPKGMNFQEVMKLIYTIPGVVKVHNLRIWSLSMDKTALSAHLVIASGENPITILKKASSIIRRDLGVFDLTLQVEEYREDMQDCTKCKEPKD
ncbi:zinc transporter 2-like isoform X2 [Stegodyphus dumicola]|uniref:zinc transporter 2-like isoform X2 n=1 Tax=Stegodyphus dumicola TaxID=202533 RepID=UPI0015B1432E|nr:zinc transporter 2-like isoform X2 [Stegodyphus dumicola]